MSGKHPDEWANSPEHDALDRARSCDTKTQYASEAKAMQVAEAIKKSDRASNCAPYACRFCQEVARGAHARGLQAWPGRLTHSKTAKMRL